MLQTQLAEFLRQVVGVAARGRALVDTTLAEDRRVTVTVACAAGAFLAIDLLGGVRGFRPCFHFVRTSLRFVTLPANDAVQDVSAGLQAEQIFVQLDRTGVATVQFDHVKFHSASPSAGASAGAST